MSPISLGYLLVVIPTILVTSINSFAQQIPDRYDTLLEIDDESFFFNFITPGTFQMGSPPEERLRGDDEGPVHRVSFTEGFYMGIYEVTQAQWRQIMGNNPAVFRIFNNSAQRPVEYISWNECQEFIKKLNQKGKGFFRLPTEAEWEYACRAGTNTAYFWGDKMAENGNSKYAWANSRSMAMTHPVGTKLPNPWGLYDMSGNVWEWCSDWFGAYNKGPSTDPKGPQTGSHKVFRGGSWYDFYESHRSANRHKHGVDEKYAAIGLRLVWEEKKNEMAN